MLNAIQLLLHIPVNVKMAISVVAFHVSQQIVHRELSNSAKLASKINVPIVNQDLHASTKMQEHRQQPVDAKKDGLEMENFVCQRKM